MERRMANTTGVKRVSNNQRQQHPTAGGVVYGDGANYASTSAGTSGQLLQSTDIVCHQGFSLPPL